MQYPKEIADIALKNIDRERARLRKEFEGAMKKLDNDERDLLGLKRDDSDLKE